MRKTLLILACSGLATLAALADGDIILGNFEDGTYQGWSIEGDAFGNGPATGKIGKQREVTGFAGKGLVNTFLNGDKSQGVLTSPEFTVNRRYLTFLVGGYWKNQTEVRVYVDGDMIDAKRGKNSDKLKGTVVDLREYQPLGEIALERVAGTVEVDAFTVYKMKSIWK